MAEEVGEDYEADGKVATLTKVSDSVDAPKMDQKTRVMRETAHGSRPDSVDLRPRRNPSTWWRRDDHGAKAHYDASRDQGDGVYDPAALLAHADELARRLHEVVLRMAEADDTGWHDVTFLAKVPTSESC